MKPRTIINIGNVSQNELDELARELSKMKPQENVITTPPIKIWYCETKHD